MVSELPILVGFGTDADGTGYAVRAAIAALGAESTVASDIEGAVNLEGPGLATVHDLP